MELVEQIPQLEKKSGEALSRLHRRKQANHAPVAIVATGYILAVLSIIARVAGEIRILALA